MTILTQPDSGDNTQSKKNLSTSNENTPDVLGSLEIVDFEAGSVNAPGLDETGYVDPSTDFQKMIRTRFLGSDAFFGDCIEFIVDTGANETYEAIGATITRFGYSLTRHDFGEMALFRNLDRSVWQAKPEFPRQDKTGKVIKYESVRGQAGIFRPAIDPVTLTELQPGTLVITEGGFKTIASIGAGFDTVGLAGVWNGVIQDAIKEHQLHPDLLATITAAAPKRVVIAFDQDTKYSTRVQVSKATNRLIKHLKEAQPEEDGAKFEVFIARWQPKLGKGIDDLIANGHGSTYIEAINNALPTTTAQRQERYARRVTRPADVLIDDGTDCTNPIAVAAIIDPNNEIIVLDAFKGAGKTSAVKAAMALSPKLKIGSISHLRSLSGMLAEKLGLANISDGGISKKSSIGYSACTPSITKLLTMGMPDVLILDEIAPTLQSLYFAGNVASNNRAAQIKALEALIQGAGKVIIADADLTDAMIEIVERLRGGKAFVIRCTKKSLTFPVEMYVKCKDIFGKSLTPQRNLMGKLFDVLSALETESKIVYVACDSKAFAESLERLLSNNGYKSFVISSENSGDDSRRAFLAAAGDMLPELLKDDVKVIICTPSVAQGFSIQTNTELIDSVFGFFSGVSIGVEDCVQAICRVRSNAPRYVMAGERGRARSPFSSALNIDGFRNDLMVKRQQTKFVPGKLEPVAEHVIGLFDPASPHIDMMASLTVNLNVGMINFGANFAALCLHEGQEVTTIEHSVSPVYLSMTADFAECSKLVKQEHRQAIVDAITITEREFEVLQMKKDSLTPAERLQVAKYKMQEFYNGDVTLALAEYDREGDARTKIRNYESMIDDELAKTRTSNSINANPETAQDWSNQAAWNFIMQKSGAAKWIQNMIDTTGDDAVDFDGIEPICDFLRAHSSMIRTLIGVNTDKVSDRYLIGVLLEKVGIKLKRYGSRAKGENNYKINWDYTQQTLDHVKHRADVRAGIAAKFAVQVETDTTDDDFAYDDNGDDDFADLM